MTNRTHVMLYVLAMAALAGYFFYLGVGYHDCRKRGGVPVPWPGGIQCAARLR